jgi:hypothetical protein
MAEARLWLGEKTVMELDPVTGGWFLKVQIDGTSVTPIGVTENWRVALYPEETITGSNKIVTVPAGQEWQILWIWVEFSSTGTVGTRQIGIMVMDNASDVIGRYQAGVTQIVNLTNYYLFAPALGDMIALRDTNFLTTPLPTTMLLSAGQQLRIWDNKAINAGGDQMVLQIQYAWRNV